MRSNRYVGDGGGDWELGEYAVGEILPFACIVELF